MTQYSVLHGLVHCEYDKETIAWEAVTSPNTSNIGHSFRKQGCGGGMTQFALFCGVLLIMPNKKLIHLLYLHKNQVTPGIRSSP